MLLMLWLVLCTGVNLIVIPPSIVIMVGLFWFFLDVMLLSGVHTRLVSNKAATSDWEG